MAPPVARTQAPELALSPALSAMAEARRGGDADAPERLWRRAQRAGGPLVEELPEDPDHRAVTFLWKDTEEPAPDVLLLLDTVTDRHREELGPAILRPLAGGRLRAVTYRLRSDVRASYRFHVAPRIVPDAGAVREDWWAVVRATVPDPLNEDRLSPFGPDELSILTLPDAPAQPWRTPAGEPQGRVERHLVPSEHLGGERETWVYLPAGDALARAGVATAPLDVVVLLDGDVWGDRVQIAPTLDALIAARAIPPVCVLMPHALDGPTRMREMGMDDGLVSFLADELLPWAAERWPLTDDPARTVVAGQSMGGLAALFAGFSAPGRFGNVVSQSGSFWWPEWPEDDGGARQERALAWIADRAPADPDPRVWMEAGRHEWMLLDANRRMRDALTRRGTVVDYREYGGGHDYACWRGGLADGLVALLG